MMYRELQKYLGQTKRDSDVLCRIIDALPYDKNEIGGDALIQLVELVPEIAEILDRDMDERMWSTHSTICYLLAHLGSRAEVAVPALLKHIERFPRFELNAWAVGWIGGPGVVRRLTQWTYWQGESYDRKRTDSVCGAIRCLGAPAIAELLELASPVNDDEVERARALLNLLDNTTHPPADTLTLMGAELDRQSCDACIDTLVDAIIRVAREHPHQARSLIEPLALGHAKNMTARYMQMLSELQ